MQYRSVNEIAKKWNVSERSVRNYCAQGRVDGAFLTGKTWNIPENAEKPERSNKKKEQPITLLDILQEQKASRALRREAGFKEERRKGGFQRREGGFGRDRREGGFQHQEGGFRENRREGGFQRREGGFGRDRREGGFQHQERGFRENRREGGFQRREGGFERDRRGGGFQRREGGFRKPGFGGRSSSSFSRGNRGH